jgi:hypothetical protein
MLIYVIIIDSNRLLRIYIMNLAIILNDLSSLLALIWCMCIRFLTNGYNQDEDNTDALFIDLEKGLELVSRMRYEIGDT